MYVRIYNEAVKNGYDGQKAITLMTWYEIEMMQENNMPVFSVTTEIQNKAYLKTLENLKEIK